MSAQPHGPRFKGTRSQLRLSDFFSKLPPQSPLKVARSARHNPPVRVPAALAMSETDNADDVIYSPRKRAPGDDERSRGHKRPRRDDGPSTHTPAYPHDQDRPLDLPTSHSCALPVSGQSEHSPPATVTRAQSVPAFLFSTPGAVGVVPRLDLTKVGGTPSPRRVHSSGKLRIRSIPPADVHVPPLKIVDEDIENVAIRLPTKTAEASGVPRMELMSNSVDEPVESGLVNSIPSPEIPIATHHTAGIQQTPRYTYSMNLDLGSPLTPLPPTPHPTKMLVTRGDRKSSRSGLRFELEAAHANAEALPSDQAVAPLRRGAKSSLPTPGSQPRTTSQSGRATDPPAFGGPEFLPANDVIASSSMPALKGRASPSMISRMRPKPKTDSSRPIFARNPRMTRSVSKGLVKDTRADMGPDTTGISTGAVDAAENVAFMGRSTQEVKSAMQVTEEGKMRERDVTIRKTTKILPGQGRDKPAFGTTSVKPPADPVKRPVSSILGPTRSPSKTHRVPSSSHTLPSRKPASSPGRLIRSGSVCSSTLSTLSNALDKLTLPPPKRPTRPSTSLGFNRDNTQSLPPDAKQTKNDVDVGASAGGRSNRPRKVSGLGLGRPSTASGPPNRTRISGPQESAVEAAAKAMAKATVTAFGPGAGCAPLGVGAEGRRAGPRDFGRGRGGRVATLSTFGFGARVGARASKQTTLSSVAASPIKGGDGGGSGEQEADVRVADSSTVTKKEEEGEEAFWTGASTDTGKGNATNRDEWVRRASRRASLASHALSHSLDAAPEASLAVPGPAKSMGSPGSTGPLSRNNVRILSSGRATRSAAGVQDRAMGAQGAGQASVAFGIKRSKEANVVKKVLDGCTVFVDVKSQEGDEAGSLFVDMCAQMGAKILQRLSQSCTHIIFKNGLMSTITKYRLLKDPKPSVVNIAWVVDVAEQRVKLDEAAYNIDLLGMNVAGTLKRRRSMLPKQVQISEDGGSTLPASSSDPIKIEDQSLDASSSILSNDDLAPLEKARRRQLMIATRSDLVTAINPSLRPS